MLSIGSQRIGGRKRMGLTAPGVGHGALVSHTQTPLLKADTQVSVFPAYAGNQT